MRVDIWEASEFPDLAQRYAVYAVPKTVVNETGEILGAVSEADFVKAVVEAVGASALPSA